MKMPAAAHDRTSGAPRYEGKAKRLWPGPAPGTCLMEFTDAVTAGNGARRDEVEGKGAANARISSILMRAVGEAGIPTHFLDDVDEITHLVRDVEIVPLEVIVRNIAAGSLSRTFGIEEGTPLEHPLVELCWKRDDLGDPLLAHAHVAAFGIADADTVDAIELLALRVNDVLIERFAALALVLVDFKLEFGRTPEGTIVLADEMSPDTCRIWRASDGTKLDKDRFRRDLGDLLEGYGEVLDRLETVEVAR
jgi:phosphoribosylaminoimidazole-succinocarboxamide synthase